MVINIKELTLEQEWEIAEREYHDIMLENIRLSKTEVETQVAKKAAYDKLSKIKATLRALEIDMMQNSWKIN